MNGAGGSPPSVDTSGRTIVLVSPHYDDVPLSLGQSLIDGALSRARRVEVRVVFGRTNWSVMLHPKPSRTRVVTAVRRTEEALAARRFGYRVRTEPLEEAILRLGTLDPETFRGDGPVAGDPLVDEIEAMARRWSRGADEVWFCAGVGSHVDHRLVAEAGARLAREDAGGIAFYEERPYTAYLTDDQIAHEVSALGLPMEPRVVSGPIAASTQRTVRRIYRSQIDEYFREAQEIDRSEGRVERVWLPT